MAAQSTSADARFDPEDVELDDSYPLFYSPIEPSGRYVGAAAVLAGFCFTAVVLIVTLDKSNPGEFDRAVGALLTAFLGLVLSAFLESIVSGQTRRSRRTFRLALLSSVSLATSALFALWGMCEVIDVVFSRPRLLDLVSGVFVVGSIVIAVFVANVGVNVRRLAGMDPRDAWTRLVIGQLVAVFVAEILRRHYNVTEQTSIDRIAIAQLVGLTVVIVSTLLYASWGGLPRRPDGRWLRGWGASVARACVAIGSTYFVVALPTALAWLLLARLPSQPFV